MTFHIILTASRSHMAGTRNLVALSHYLECNKSYFSTSWFRCGPLLLREWRRDISLHTAHWVLITRPIRYLNRYEFRCFRFEYQHYEEFLRIHYYWVLLPFYLVHLTIYVLLSYKYEN